MPLSGSVWMVSGGVWMLSWGVWVVLRVSGNVSRPQPFAKDYIRSGIASSSNALMPSEA